MANLSIGINLDNRTLSLNIPDETTIEDLKYIAKVNSNNYIAEDTVNGVSRGYYHFLNENDEAETAIFYQYDGTTTSVNIDSFTLPDNFGTITEVDETATLFNYINRNSHEKVYVVSEDYAKSESMTKDDIKSFIRGYGVPVDSVFNYDGNDIPGGFEEVEGIGTTFYFNTIEDMKTTELKSGDIAVILGFYDKYDKGTYLFYINPIDGEITLENGQKAKVIKDESEVAYIFPKNFINTGSGDISLIKAYGKNIVIDTHRASSKTQVYQFLDDNNVSHIDYLIITHYHDDHMGNVANLISDGYVDKNTNVYLPAYCNLITNNPTYLALYNEVINALNNAEISYTIPSENSYLTLGLSFKLTFYNCDEEMFDESGWTAYNNMSTMCLVEHKHVKSLYVGDCDLPSMQRAVNNGFINSKIDLYKIEHHGVNFESPQQALKICIPDYAVQLSSINDSKINNFAVTRTLSNLKHMKTKIFSQHKNNENQIAFISSNNEMKNISGVESLSISNRTDYFVYYVDASTTNDVQNGSQDYPFVELSQAIGEALDRNFGTTEIYLADGNYNYRHSADTKNRANYANCDISIYGNSEHPENVVLHNGIKSRNSKLQISGVTIYSDNYDCIEASQSTINITKCVLTAQSPSSNNCITSSDNCKLTISNSTLENSENGISAHNDIILSINNTFSNLSRAYKMSDRSLLNNINDTYNNVTSRIATSDNYILIQSPKYKILASSQNIGNGDITLNDDITNYNRIIVLSGAKSMGTLFNSEIFAYTNERFSKGATYNGLTKSGTVAITIDSSDTQLVHVVCSGSDNIRAIYGIYDQYE